MSEPVPKSTTPRTDEENAIFRRLGLDADFVTGMFARQLEYELNEAINLAIARREYIKDLRAVLTELMVWPHHNGVASIPIESEVMYAARALLSNTTFSKSSKGTT